MVGTFHVGAMQGPSAWAQVAMSHSDLHGLMNLNLADPGKARGYSTNTFVIHSVSLSVSLSLPQFYGADTPKRLVIDYVIVIKTFVNPEGHQNTISGSKVMAILLKALIFPTGGVASGRVRVWSLRSRLGFFCILYCLDLTVPSQICLSFISVDNRILWRSVTKLLSLQTSGLLLCSQFCPRKIKKSGGPGDSYHW